MTVKIGLPDTDWLTLSGLDQSEFSSLRWEWMSIGEKRAKALNASMSRLKLMTDRATLRSETASVMGYKGSLIEGVFFGARERNEVLKLSKPEQEFLIRASGKTAGEFIRMCPPNASKWKATRLDVQITCDRNGVNMMDLERVLRGDWEVGRRPKVESFHGNAIGDSYTIYVGSRQSERFVRIYLKPVSGTDPLVRFEAELKGGMANEAFAMIMSSHSSHVAAGEILKAVWSKLPAAARSILSAHGEALRDYDPTILHWQKRVEGNKTLEWLWEAVLPAVARLASEGGEDSDLAAWLSAVVMAMGIATVKESEVEDGHE